MTTTRSKRRLLNLLGKVAEKKPEYFLYRLDQLNQELNHAASTQRQTETGGGEKQRFTQDGFKIHGYSYCKERKSLNRLIKQGDLQGSFQTTATFRDGQIEEVSFVSPGYRTEDFGERISSEGGEAKGETKTGGADSSG